MLPTSVSRWAASVMMARLCARYPPAGWHSWWPGPEGVSQPPAHPVPPLPITSPTMKTQHTVQAMLSCRRAWSLSGPGPGPGGAGLQRHCGAPPGSGAASCPPSPGRSGAGASRGPANSLGGKGVRAVPGRGLPAPPSPAGHASLRCPVSGPAPPQPVAKPAEAAPGGCALAPGLRARTRRETGTKDGGSGRARGTRAPRQTRAATGTPAEGGAGLPAGPGGARGPVRPRPVPARPGLPASGRGKALPSRGRGRGARGVAAGAGP